MRPRTRQRTGHRLINPPGFAFELGDGWHGYRHYCPVLIGGSWAFKTGRYMYWPHTTPAEMRVPSQILAGGTTRLSGIPHQRLLVSVAGAMGLEVVTWVSSTFVGSAATSSI